MKGVKEAFIDAGEISQMLGIGTVSYTHLDVYKRQVLMQQKRNMQNMKI